MLEFVYTIRLLLATNCMLTATSNSQMPTTPFTVVTIAASPAATVPPWKAVLANGHVIKSHPLPASGSLHSSARTRADDAPQCNNNRNDSCREIFDFHTQARRGETPITSILYKRVRTRAIRL